MKRACFVCLILCLTTFLLSQSNNVPAAISASQADPKAQAKILDSYGKLPLSFEANNGQTDARVKFLSRTGGYTLFLTGDEAVLTLSGKREDTKAKIVGAAHTMPPVAATKGGGVLRMKLRNANPAARVTGVDELAGKSNYFIGNDPTKWHGNVPTYRKVEYKGIYPGVDLVFYGTEGRLEYDFIVAPGAKPRRIQFDVRGTKRIRRDAHGDLVLKMGGDEIRWHKPVVYQEKNGVRQEIAAHYTITGTNRVAFELAKYDASRPLYIDPLIYSTYLGGSGEDSGYGIAVDSTGNAYVTGSTESTDFPTMNPLQPANGGGYDAFVSKINPAGSALVYSTYLGGSGTDSDSGNSVAVDSAGDAFVTGDTNSTDFPVTPGAFQTTCNGCGGDSSTAFVTKFNPSGSALIYSTYLGGSEYDVGSGIAVDSAGDAYVTGNTFSTDFPVTPGAFQTTFGGDEDAFVTEFNPSGSALIYSTYLGGSGDDWGRGIVVDGAGSAYVTGYTSSTDFPVTPGAFQTTCCGAFVTKFNPTGTALVYSTYLDNGEGFGIAVDGAGDAYVTGLTESTDFPVTPRAFQTVCGGACLGNAFVTEFNPSGSTLVYSTYLGGSGFDLGWGIAVDSAGDAYVTGETRSTDFPTTPGAFQTKYGRYPSAFVTRVNLTGSALVYSTYLGGRSVDRGFGIAVDSVGGVYITGLTYGNFPTRNPLQPVYGGKCDAFVSKFYLTAATTTTLSSSPNPSTYGQAVTFTAVVTSYLGTPADGETVSFMKGKTVLGTGTLSGGSASFTTSTLKVGTTAVKTVYGGDSNFAGSTSKAVKQLVKKAGE